MTSFMNSPDIVSQTWIYLWLRKYFGAMPVKQSTLTQSKLEPGTIGSIWYSNQHSIDYIGPIQFSSDSAKVDDCLINGSISISISISISLPFLEGAGPNLPFKTELMKFKFFFLSMMINLIIHLVEEAYFKKTNNNGQDGLI